MSTILNQIGCFAADITAGAPATREAIALAEAELGVSFPQEYRRFLRESNGIECVLHNGQPLVWWPAEQLYEWNKEYAAREFAPGIILFGTTLSEMAIGFDSDAGVFISIPFIPMNREELVVHGPSLVSIFEYYGAAS